MKLGFIKPIFPGEKRVALLPGHINDFENELIVESGYGSSLGIKDEEYEKAGCRIAGREEVFRSCQAVLSLKLIMPADYEYLREGQMIIGWTHPTGSGRDFMEKQAGPKELMIVDLDNIYPSIYYRDRVIPIDWLEPNFIYKNSYYAGYSSTMHGLMSYGLIPDSNTRVAVLSSGNTAQGAFDLAAKLGADVRMFYRRTMPQFKRQLGEFDVIINGIEVDQQGLHILTLAEQRRLKEGCLIIDAAADAGNAIEGTEYTTLDDPIYEREGRYYYEVNNTPSIYYRVTSEYISEVFSSLIYKKDVRIFLEMVEGRE